MNYILLQVRKLNSNLKQKYLTLSLYIHIMYILITGNILLKISINILIFLISLGLYYIVFPSEVLAQPVSDDYRIGFYERAELPADDIQRTNNYPRIGNPAHYEPTYSYSTPQGPTNYIPYTPRGTTGLHELNVSYSEVNSMDVNAASVNSDLHEVPSHISSLSSDHNQVYDNGVGYHSDEYVLDKTGSTKLGFGFLNSSIHSIYVKFHDKSKRKFF
jgi:hypothetical protein